MVRLRAEMKVPGKAWLQFQVRPHEDTQALLSQTAFFAPKGLMGLLYWYVLYPLHRLIFSGLIDQIAERCTTKQNPPEPPVFFPAHSSCARLSKVAQQWRGDNWSFSGSCLDNPK